MWSHLVLYANGQLPQRISHCQVANLSYSHGRSTRISCMLMDTRCCRSLGISNCKPRTTIPAADVCSNSVCCCYKGGGGFVKITPSGNSCKRSFGGSQVWVTIVLAGIVIVVMLAASCYFNGRLCISPYKPVSQRSAARSRESY